MASVRFYLLYLSPLQAAKTKPVREKGGHTQSALAAITVALYWILAVASVSAAAESTQQHRVKLDQQNTATLRFSQSATQATLITLATQGMDIAMSVRSPSSGHIEADYSWQLLHSVLFVPGSTCTQCEISIKATPSPDSNTLPVLTLDTQAWTVSKPRAQAELALQRISTLHFDLNSDNALRSEFENAIQVLEQSDDRLTQLRACRYRTIEALYSSEVKKKLHVIQSCGALANDLEAPAIAFYLEIENIKHAYWHQDEEQKALRLLNQNYRDISAQLDQANGDHSAKYLLGRNLLTQGMIQSKLGRYNHASQSLNQAKSFFQAIGSDYNLAEALSELGTVLRFQNRYSEAARFFEQAHHTNTQSVRPDLQQQMRINYNMAAVCLLNGQYYLALKLIESIETNNRIKTSLWQAHILALKARVLLELNRLDEAEALYEITWQLYQQLGATSHLATLANNLSKLYTNKGEIEKSLQFTERAVSLAGNSWGADQNIRIQQTRVNHHMQLGHYDQALAKLTLIEQQLIDSADPYRLGRVLSQKGETLLHKKDYAAAINTLKLAQEQHQQAEDHLYSTRSHYLLSKTLFLSGRSKASIEPYIHAAKSTIESIRSTFLDDQVRQEYFALQKNLYELSLQVHLRGTNPTGAFDSLYEAESFKARTLFENMTLTAADATAVEEQKISFEFLESSFKAVQLPPNQNHTLPKLSKDALLRHQATLPDHEAILYYFLGNTESYGWIIDGDSISVHRLPSADELTKQTNDLIESLNKDPAASNRRDLWANIVQADRVISETLLAPLQSKLADIDHLTIIPDGALHRLTFSVLLSPASGYRKTLNESLSISYANSIATIQHLQNKPANSVNNGLLMIANPVTEAQQGNDHAAGWANQNEAFARLPASEREAKRLLKLWGDDTKTKLLIGHEASKENVVLSGLENYQVIHFASHAYIDWSNPANSAIKLASSPTSAPFNSPDLTLADISKLRLNAELVVLSACETAAGKLTTGEGPIGLSRAFFEAGANRVLASLWPVEDNATAALLELFYRALIDFDYRPDKALQFAQQEMMKDQYFSHPYYWSGFIFVGNSKTWHQPKLTTRQKITQLDSTSANRQRQNPDLD